jgi:hypothetical protein
MSEGRKIFASECSSRLKTRRRADRGDDDERKGSRT